MRYTYEYPRPTVTVDVVVIDPTRKKVLLVKRGKEPFKGMWALPGGHVEQDEDLDIAAARELNEETSVAVLPGALEQLGAYGAPGRDPRGWCVDIAYLLTTRNQPEARAGDDAAEVGWFSVDDPHGLPELAFNHWQIINDALARLGE